jgi:DNA-binding SARP family transcriptional activator
MTARSTHSAARAVAALASLLALAALTAGIPLALYAISGSPIPRALPSGHQVITTLTSRDNGTLFLAAIRYITWAAWACFTFSVLVEAVSRARGRPAPRLPVIAPVQGIAAALIGAAILSTLPFPHGARPVSQAARPAPVTAAAPPRPGDPVQALTAAMTIRAAPVRTAASGSATGHQQHYQEYEVAEGDNLWDIAEHFTGNGQAWHQIFTLNRGRPQPDGRSLTRPDLILPGWILLIPLPGSHNGTTSHTPAGHRPPQHHPDKSPQPRHQPSRHHTQTPPHRHAPSHQQGRPVGIQLPGGGLAGITLAAAISAALVAWRLHRRRVATARWPSPPRPAEPPVPEVISRLRRAHLDSLAADAAEARGEPWDDEQALEAPAADDDDGLDEFGAPAGPAAWLPGSLYREPATGAAGTGTGTGENHPGRADDPSDGEPEQEKPARWLPAPPPARPLPVGTITFGMRGNTEIPLDTAAGRGLGLTGPGAAGTAGALLASLLASGDPGAGRPAPQVIIPEADAQQLIPGHGTAVIAGVDAGPADGLIITTTLTAALDHIETEITRRLRIRESLATAASLAGRAAPPASRAPAITAALIARPDRPATRRLQAVLEVGTAAGVIGILLGNWETGISCYIDADGIVTSATGADLTGVQTFHLPGRDTVTLLSLLHGASGNVADDRPGIPVPLDSPPAPAAQNRPPAEASTASERRPPGGRHGPPPAPRPPAVPPARADGAEPQRDHNPQARRDPGTTVTAEAPAPARPAPATATRRPVQVRLLGTPGIEAAGREVTTGLRRSSRELLAFLALFPDGASGEKVIAALWPDHTADSARTALQTALRSLRVALRTATGAPGPMFITYGAGRYRIDSNLIDIDLWSFQSALASADQALRARDQAAARDALARAGGCYRGPLAEDASYEWIESYREQIRRQAVDALTRLAGMHEPAESEHALAILDRALAHDPVNEQLHQRIMKIQARLGHADAIHRTLSLLETRLGALGMTPSQDTYAVAAELQRPRPEARAPGTGPSASPPGPARPARERHR